jgi:hypothetical protein
VLGVSLLSAKTYSFTVDQAAKAGTADLTPGDYKVKLDGSKVILLDRSGHQIDTTATVQTSERKFDQTAVSLSNTNGKARIDSIELRGTKDKVVFQ